MLLEQGYKLINSKTIPESHRERYNHATLVIQECEDNGMTDKANTWRDHRHAVMMLALMATTGDQS